MLHNTKAIIHNEDRAVTNIYAPINTAANFTKKTEDHARNIQKLTNNKRFDTELLT